MISLRTNMSSLIARCNMGNSTNKLNLAVERLSTGQKINHASDNAANYSIATDMQTKLNSYMVAEDNVLMGMDMLDTMNSSLDLITNKLNRLRSLCEQASNGTYGSSSLDAIKAKKLLNMMDVKLIYGLAELFCMLWFADIYPLRKRRIRILCLKKLLKVELNIRDIFLIQRKIYQKKYQLPIQIKE